MLLREVRLARIFHTQAKKTFGAQGALSANTESTEVKQ